MIHLNTKKILIPVDFSETSMLAVRHGAFLAQCTKGEVILLHVIAKHWEKFSVIPEDVSLENYGRVEGQVKAKMEETANAIRQEYGVNVDIVVTAGMAYKEIVKVAEESGSNMVVMGTHGYSPIEELFVGSNALRVITKSKAHVMTMTQQADKLGYSKILLPIDTTTNSRQKVVLAMELAKVFTAHVYVVGLLTENESNEKGAMQVVMKQIEKVAAEKEVNCSTEILENVKRRAVATVEYGEKVGADIIVINTDQDVEVSGFFLGPYEQQVIHLAKVPVLSVKPKDNYNEGGSGFLGNTAGI